MSAKNIPHKQPSARFTDLIIPEKLILAALFSAIGFFSIQQIVDLANNVPVDPEGRRFQINPSNGDITVESTATNSRRPFIWRNGSTTDVVTYHSATGQVCGQQVLKGTLHTPDGHTTISPPTCRTLVFSDLAAMKLAKKKAEQYPSVKRSIDVSVMYYYTPTSGSYAGQPSARLIDLSNVNPSKLSPDSLWPYPSRVKFPPQKT